MERKDTRRGSATPDVPFPRELLPAGFNAEAVAFAVAAVHERADLNPKLLACLLAIVRHVNHDTGLANVGYSRLMLLTGSGRPNTIAGWLKDLTELGYIEKDKREGPNGSNIFRVPVLTYLPSYQGVGVSDTDVCTTESRYERDEEEGEEEQNQLKGSTDIGKRYSEGQSEFQPLSRANAVEQAGEDAVVLSELFTQTLIGHGKKRGRYLSDAYRPRWLQGFIRLDQMVSYSVSEEVSRRGPFSAEYMAAVIKVRQNEVRARCSAVFEYIATYEGDDEQIQGFEKDPSGISETWYYRLLKLSGFESRLGELPAPEKPPEPPRKDLN